MRSPRVDVSLLTAESREIYIGEHIVARSYAAIVDRARRGVAEIIVLPVTSRVQRPRDPIDLFATVDEPTRPGRDEPLNLWTS